MIRINLLPHREQKRAARQRELAFMAGAASVLGLLIVIMIHTYLSTQIENQEARNTFLVTEIKKLDDQIAEIQVLKEQTQAMLARKQVVETLQSNRSAVVYLLDQLVRQLPDGVYLKAVKQSGNSINLQGYAQSNARVATLMRSLEASPWLQSPNLIEVKAATINNLRASEFSLNVKLAPPEAAADKGKGEGSAKSKDKKA
ncbi:fimbrial assembly family protein [Sulfuricella denitrificans skB26]|uniref:Fimbrial assembly family protein n=1 Tax=Sulfuricella denitrificans (strain DSM 22764 / NBRC 105220 / skB26) TaxID=1163617 RepID=S6AK58_SULDS|nr:PilN domain-containing protein [Sulfuricella denitrificans]BAN36741.1 fimbrial assembly family protein [Sulfuricella denitrificans skB26]